ncbi:hypothetical protein [Streptomyces liangshanensis]|uniref:hypothetical protein n=1 Tax=Streptomyces liangshanensis TaxID=2717324 RepID=UPI0036DDE37C
MATGAVAVIDAENTKNGVDFPEDALPDIQVMADLSVDVAHRAGVPLAGYLVVEGLTDRQAGDRAIVRAQADLMMVRRLSGRVPRTR